jgi:DNA-binding PadR family transcriptional regulator
MISPDDVLLGLLADRPRHGYPLIQCFRDRVQLGSVWALGMSQLYAVLKRLESLELIEGRTHEPEAGPARTEFALTASGHERLERWLQDAAPAADPERVRVEFLSRLYVARLLGCPTAAIVQRQRDACLERRRVLAERRAQSMSGVDWLALEFDISQNEAVLGWIARCELIPRTDPELDQAFDHDTESEDAP